MNRTDVVALFGLLSLWTIAAFPQADTETSAARPVEVAQQDNPLTSYPRRPMWYIQAGSGRRGPDNPAGLMHWWNREPQDAINAFAYRVMLGFSAGARDFVINRPQGTNGISHVGAGSWTTIGLEKRELLADLIRPLEADEGVRFYPFIGSGMRRPDDIAGWNPGDSDEGQQLGDHDTPRKRVFTQIVLGGWMSTGASGLVIDNSAPEHERDHFIELARDLHDLCGFRLIGEELPYARDGRGQIMRDENGVPIWDDSLHAMPWLITWERWKRFKDQPIKFDPATTRIYLWFHQASRTIAPTEKERLEIVAEAVERGLIPITDDRAMFRLASKLIGDGD